MACLMRYMHNTFSRPSLAIDSAGWALCHACPPCLASQPMLGRFVQVYCDNILISSKTRGEHSVHVCMVLETLRHHKLYAKASKCQFGRSSVGFLGHDISEHVVAIDPSKVSAVAEWAAPTCCHDARRFESSASLITTVAFVHTGCTADRPLYSSCVVFAGSRRAGELQRAPSRVSVCAGTTCVRQTCWLTDASELAVPAIPEQPDDAGKFHPVAFELRKLTEPERQYPPICWSSLPWCTR